MNSEIVFFSCLVTLLISLMFGAEPVACMWISFNSAITSVSLSVFGGNK